MCLWWSLCTLYLLSCQVRVTIGDSSLCCVCTAAFEYWLTPLFVYSILLCCLFFFFLGLLVVVVLGWGWGGVGFTSFFLFQKAKYNTVGFYCDMEIKTALQQRLFKCFVKEKYSLLWSCLTVKIGILSPHFTCGWHNSCVDPLNKIARSPISFFLKWLMQILMWVRVCIM